MSQNTFKKSERLKSSRIITELFNSGNTITVAPLKFLWNLHPDTGFSIPARMAIAVPSKNFKRAVDRNLIKRRIREAYRIHKHNLYELLSTRNICLNFVFLYLPRTIHPYKQISEAVMEIMKIVSEKINMDLIESRQ